MLPVCSLVALRPRPAMKNKSLVTTCLATLVALLGIWLWRSDRGGVVVSPTFAEHVAPIVFDNCVVCHQPEGIGPFTLLDYDEVKARGAQIAEVTRSGYMPPWLPERGGHSFVGERGLTQDEIDTLRVWVETGMPPGDPQKMPARATLDGGWPLGEPDLVVTMPEVFELSAEGSDVFRNFVIPLTLDETKYVRAVDLRPGATKALHHAVILVDETESSRLRDAEDDVVGFEGMELGGRSKNPEGHFVGWTPGKTATLGDPDLAWALPRGSDLVLMLHLLPSGRPEPSVASGIANVGKPACVHGRFITGSPVDSRPSGATPREAGEIHRSTPCSALSTISSRRSSFCPARARDTTVIG